MRRGALAGTRRNGQVGTCRFRHNGASKHSATARAEHISRSIAATDDDERSLSTPGQPYKPQMGSQTVPRDSRLCPICSLGTLKHALLDLAFRAPCNTQCQ